MFAIFGKNSARLDATGIRTSGWLGQRKSGQLFASGQLWQILVLLFFSAIQQQTFVANRLMSTEINRYTQIVTAHKFSQSSVLRVVAAHATIILWNLNTEGAQVLQQLQVFLIERIV